MPVRFVVSHVVISHGLYNLILEGQDGGGAPVRMPMPMPVAMPSLVSLPPHPLWNVQDTRCSDPRAGGSDGGVGGSDGGGCETNSTRAAPVVVAGAAGPAGGTLADDHRPDGKPPEQRRQRREEEQQGASRTPGGGRSLPRFVVPPPHSDAAGATVAAALASAVAGAAAAGSGMAHQATPSPCPATGPTAALAWEVAGPPGAGKSQPHSPTAPIVAGRSPSGNILNAAAALLSSKQRSGAAAAASGTGLAAAFAAPAAAAASRAGLSDGPRVATSLSLGDEGHKDGSSAQAAASVSASASTAVPNPACNLTPVTTSAAASTSGWALDSASATASATTGAPNGTQGGGGGGRRNGPPPLSRPDAPSASRLLACFNPTTLVRRSGTVRVGPQGQEERRRRKPLVPRPAGASRPADTAAPPHFTLSARPLPALLHLLRTGTLPPLPSREHPGSRRVAERPGDGAGDAAGGAESSTGPRRSPQSRRPAAFRPTVLVSRTGQARVRAPRGAVDAERWGFLVGEGPWAEGTAAPESSGTAMEQGGLEGDGPSLLQVLREANPAAIVRRLAWAASGRTPVLPAEAPPSARGSSGAAFPEAAPPSLPGAVHLADAGADAELGVADAAAATQGAVRAAAGAQAQRQQQQQRREQEQLLQQQRREQEQEQLLQQQRQQQQWRDQEQEVEEEGLAQLQLIRAVGEATSLESLAAIMDQHLEAMGAVAVATSCRTIITLVQTAAGGGGRAPAWCGAAAPNLHCQHGALEYLGQAYGPRAAPGLRIRTGGGDAAPAQATTPQAGSGGPSDSSASTSAAAAAAAAAGAAGRRLVGRLARRAVKIAAAAAATATEAAEVAAAGAPAQEPATLGQAAAFTRAVASGPAGVSAEGWPEVEAALAVLWAYGHLAEAEDQLDLLPGRDLGLELGRLDAVWGPGLGLGPDAVARRDPGTQADLEEVLGSLQQAQQQPLQEQPAPPPQQALDFAGGRGGDVAAAEGVSVGAEQAPEEPGPTSGGRQARRQRRARAAAERLRAAAEPRAPFRAVMSQLWRLLLLATWQAGGLRRPGPALPPVPAQRWASWALWAAARGAPRLVPAVLAALAVHAPWDAEGAAAASAVPQRESDRIGPSGGRAIAQRAADGAGWPGEEAAGSWPGLRRLPFRRLLSVLWGCSRYAEWAAVRNQERRNQRAGRSRRKSRAGAPLPTPGDQLASSVATTALRLLHPHVAEQLRRCSAEAAHHDPAEGPLYLTRHDLLTALGGLAAVLDRATVEREVMSLLEALSVNPAVGLEDIIAALTILHTWMPPNLDAHDDHPRLQQSQQERVQALGEPQAQRHQRMQAQGQHQEAHAEGQHSSIAVVAAVGAAAAPSRRSVQLQLETAVLRLVGGFSQEQAAEQMAVVSLGRQGVHRWRRGWYRKAAALPPYVPYGQEAQPPIPTQWHEQTVQQGRYQGSAARSRGDRGRGTLVRRLQHPMPFRLRLLYQLDLAAGMGVAVAAAATAAAAPPPDGAKPPTSLELQLHHQRRLCDAANVRQYGTHQLLELMAVLGAGAGRGASPSSPAPLRPRPVTVRCVLNALALRWLRRGVSAADLRALMAALGALRWKPRACLSIFAVAWRPFVVLDPGAVSDAALAGMAQVMGRLVSHNAPRRSFRRTRGPPRPAPEAAAAVAGGSGLSVPWPRIRRFWTNVIALATVRLDAAGLQRPPQPGSGVSGPQQRQAPTLGPRESPRATAASWVAVRVREGTPLPGRTAAHEAAPAPLSYASLVRLVWSSARQGARVAPFMVLACQVLPPVLHRLPTRWVSGLAWGLGQSRFQEPRMNEALLALLRRWLGLGVGPEMEGCNWTAACRVAWALLRTRRLNAAAPELEDLFILMGRRLQYQATTLREDSGSPPSRQHLTAPDEGMSYRPYGRLRGVRPAVNPRALAALLWAIYAEGGSRSGSVSGSGSGDGGTEAGGGGVAAGGQGVRRAGQGGLRPGPASELLDRQAVEFRSMAAYLARYALDLPPSALLQVLEVMAFSSTPSRLRCKAFLEAFTLVLERRPRWLLHSQAQVRLVQECFRHLGWWPATQMEELASRGLELAKLPQPRPLRRWQP